MTSLLGLVFVSVAAVAAFAAQAARPDCPPAFARVALRPEKAPIVLEGQVLREGSILDIDGQPFRHTGRVDPVTGQIEVRPIGGGEARFVDAAGQQLRHGYYGPGDYPIELLHPGQTVYPGRVNTESLAFRQWRYHTPEHIPDEAFNAHYMSRAQLESQLAERAGYASSQARSVRADEIAGAASDSICPLCRTMIEAAAGSTEQPFMAMDATRYVKMLGAPKILSDAKALDGSGAAFLSRAGVDPSLTKAKIQALAADTSRQGLSHKYVMDDAGKVYLFTAADQKRIMDRLGLPASTGMSHPQLAALVLDEAAAGRKIVGIGYFEAAIEGGRAVIKPSDHILNPETLDFGRYFAEYTGLNKP